MNSIIAIEKHWILSFIGALAMATSIWTSVVNQKCEYVCFASKKCMTAFACIHTRISTAIAAAWISTMAAWVTAGITTTASWADSDHYEANETFIVVKSLNGIIYCLCFNYLWLLVVLKFRKKISLISSSDKNNSKKTVPLSNVTQSRFRGISDFWMKWSRQTHK